MLGIDSLITVLKDLSTGPGSAVVWISATLAAYGAGQKLFNLSGRKPLLTPIITAVALLIALLCATGSSYDDYFKGAGMIHFLLGPATVCLAVPLFEQRSKLAKLWLPLGIGLAVGSFAAIASVVVIGSLTGLTEETLMSMVPKSVTTPIAMGISEQIGGIPGLTAAIVVATGIFGGLAARPLFRMMGVKSDSTKGAALGLAAHGMGTSTAFQISNKAGAFAGLSMGITGVLTAFMAPAAASPLLDLMKSLIDSLFS